MKATGVSSGIARREFLRISSVAAIGVSVVSLSERNLFAVSSAALVPLMDVGYAPSLPLPGSSVPLASAASILSPDPRFISSGARVAVAGARRAANHANAPGGIGVDALFVTNYRQPNNPTHFRFFSVSGRPDGDAISGQLSFNMPVPLTSGVTLMVKRQRPSTSPELTTPPPTEPEVTPLTLSLGNVAGPKLTRGVYVLAFREEATDSMPSNWNRLTLAPADGSYYIAGATFSYLILSVDYADAASPPPNRGRSAH